MQKNAFLFRFAAGDTWLVQRTHLTKKLCGWQITAACVTELDAVTRALEAKNELLAARASVHDILGQRISMLQQLLEPVPLDEEPQPDALVENMLRTYRGLGITIDVEGTLPRNMRRAQAFAAILREALSNAVCHGPPTASPSRCPNGA